MFETSKTCKEFIPTIEKKTGNPQEKDIKFIGKCTEGVHNFTDKKTQKFNRCLKKCSISIVIREMLIRTKPR